jgi:hypothetical protein
VPPAQTGLVVTLACPDEAPAPTPTVSGLSVTSGPSSGGTTLQVNGSGFTPSSTVTFGGTAAQSTVFLSPSALQVVTPAGSGTQDVVVQSAGGSSATSTADQFFFGSAPTITSLNVSQGSAAGGTTVTITGSGFTDATAVGFGSTPTSSYHVISDSEIQAVSPAESAGTVDVIVDTPAGGSTQASADEFTYLAPASGSGSGGGSSSTGSSSSGGGSSSTGTSSGGGGSSAIATTASAGGASTTGDSATLPVTCTGASPATCTITVSLTITETVKSGKITAVAAKAKAKPKVVRRTVTIGSANVTLAAGHTQTITVTLNGTGRSLLKQHHKLRVALAARLGTSVISSQTLTFTQPAKKKPAAKKHG